jgi:hypothetical protein
MSQQQLGDLGLGASVPWYAYAGPGVVAGTITTHGFAKARKFRRRRENLLRLMALPKPMTGPLQTGPVVPERATDWKAARAAWFATDNGKEKAMGFLGINELIARGGQPMSFRGMGVISMAGAREALEAQRRAQLGAQMSASSQAALLSKSPPGGMTPFATAPSEIAKARARAAASAPPPRIYDDPIPLASSEEEAELHQRMAADLRQPSAGGQAGEAVGGAIGGAGGAIAQIISGILTPLVGGGVSAFGIMQGSKDAKSMAKARAIELSTMQTTRQRDQEFELLRARQRSQATSAWWDANGRMVLVAGAIGLALITGVVAVPRIMGGSGKRRRR